MKWGVFCFKAPLYEQIQKFTSKNMEYYVKLLITISKVPWRSLKFVDESTFKDKDLRARKAITPRGMLTTAHASARFDETVTTILMSSCEENHPVFFTLKPGTNSQWDFTEFFVDCVHSGRLRSGDYFIFDNAAIHGAKDSIEVLSDIARAAAGITLLRLPTYSPELNPCELVFSKIKQWIRTN